MGIDGLISRVQSFCRSLALSTIGSLLFFGSQMAYSQSSLESDVDNARIIEMTHKALGNDVIIARIRRVQQSLPFQMMTSPISRKQEYLMPLSRP